MPRKPLNPKSKTEAEQDWLDEKMAAFLRLRPADYFDKNGDPIPYGELTPTARKVLCGVKFTEVKGVADSGMLTDVGITRELQFFTRSDIEAMKSLAKELAMLRSQVAAPKREVGQSREELIQELMPQLKKMMGKG